MFEYNEYHPWAYLSLVFLILLQIGITDKYEHNPETGKNDKPNDFWLVFTIILSILFVVFTGLAINENYQVNNQVNK